jgi:hypothetical protein
MRRNNSLARSHHGCNERCLRPSRRGLGGLSKAHFRFSSYPDLNPKSETPSASSTRGQHVSLSSSIRLSRGKNRKSRLLGESACRRLPVRFPTKPGIYILTVDVNVILESKSGGSSARHISLSQADILTKSSVVQSAAQHRAGESARAATQASVWHPHAPNYSRDIS